MMHVLWVDYKDMFLWWRRATIDRLGDEGIDVSMLTWYDEKIEEHNIDRVVGACCEVDVVLLHFGKIPQKKAAEYFALIKKTGVKIIVISCAVGLLDVADAFIDSSFELSELVALVRKVCAT